MNLFAKVEYEFDVKMFGVRVQQYRMQRGLTQVELAKIIGSCQEHLSRIECGRAVPQIDMVVRLAKALNISVSRLVADYDDINDENYLQVILDDIRGMSKIQMDMLRENIATIKK